VPTTPTLEPTTTPTTTPPPVSDCFDTTGPWSSDFPTKGALCILVDQANQGSITGGLKNGTDTIWLDVVGNAEMSRWEHVSFVAMLPKNTAIVAFIAECYRCSGVEILILNAISRSKGTGVCGQPGDVNYSQEYAFYRDPSLKCAQFIPPGF